MLDNFLAGESAGAIATRILIVEDDPEQAAELKNLLQKMAFRCRLPKTRRPGSVIISDVRAGFVISGSDSSRPERLWEICERMKQWNDAVPVLVLTEITLDAPATWRLAVVPTDISLDGTTSAFLFKEPDQRYRQVWERTHWEVRRATTTVDYAAAGWRNSNSVRTQGRTMAAPRLRGSAGRTVSPARTRGKGPASDPDWLPETSCGRLRSQGTLWRSF